MVDVAGPEEGQEDPDEVGSSAVAVGHGSDLEVGQGQFDDAGSSTVVVGHGSGLEAGQDLQRFVSQRRYGVETFLASGEDADKKIDQWVRNSTADPKMFFLVVSQADVEEGDRPWVRSGVLAQARTLLSAFGKGRVILIVESGIFDFDYKSGLDDVLYPGGNISATYRSVAAFLLREFPSEGGTLGAASGTRRRPKEREPLERDVKFAILALSLAALLGSIYIFRSFSSNTVAVSPPTIPAGFDLSVPGTSNQTAGPVQTQPSGPPTTGPDIIPALPATCTVSLVKATTFPAVLSCDNGGVLRVTGHAGPWHNSVARVGLESQITGSFQYEETGEVVEIGPGVTNLDPAKSQYGVDEFVFQFTADGKRVQFEQFTDQGKRVVTMTFDAGSN